MLPWLQVRSLMLPFFERLRKVKLPQVRAQVLVLRKGLLDEREKSSQSRDAEVGKSQKLRSLQQEIDGLSFR